MEGNCRIEQRYFERDEVNQLMRMIKICVDSQIQFSVTPTPESVTDTSHTGWRISFPVA